MSMSSNRARRPKSARSRSASGPSKAAAGNKATLKTSEGRQNTRGAHSSKRGQTRKLTEKRKQFAREMPARDTQACGVQAEQSSGVRHLGPHTAKASSSGEYRRDIREQVSASPAREGAPAKGVRFIEISAEYAGQRIDNFLLRELRGAPKTLIYRLLRKGEVRVNKKRIKPLYKLQLGDQVRIAPVRLAAEKEIVPVSRALSERIQAAVLFENEELMIINKPSGLAVHGGSGVNLGLIEALRQIRPGARFLELVHRLDRETSGCVMIAKKRSALRALHEDLRDNRIDKIYRALVIGHWPRHKQHIKLPLKKNELKSGERVVRPDPEGKQALTEFKVLEEFAAGYSLVQAKPITGRTHQIRVHCQHAGHAIVGDDKYGQDEVNARMKTQGFNRLYLHAYELRLQLPKSRERISVTATEDPRLLDALAAMRDQGGPVQ